MPMRDKWGAWDLTLGLPKIRGNKDNSILRSMLRSPDLGKLPLSCIFHLRSAVVALRAFEDRDVCMLACTLPLQIILIIVIIASIIVLIIIIVMMVVVIITGMASSFEVLAWRSTLFLSCSSVCTGACGLADMV